MFQLDHDVYNKAAATRLSERLGDARMLEGQNSMAVNDQKIKQAKVERAVQYLGMATPENWQSVRQQAIMEGLGDEGMIPAAYDENWIQQTKAAFADAQGQLPTSAIQNFKFSEMLGGDPARQGKFEEMARASKIMDAGGQIIQVNPFSGQSNTVAAKTVPPQDMPDLKSEQERAKATGKAVGESEGAIEKRVIQAPQMEELLKQAETILPNASSGWLDAKGTAAVNLFGKSTEGSKANRQLQVISAALAGNVPRFEGPQGVLDVQLYQQAAGDVGNPNIPYEDRLAAVATIRNLQQKYSQMGSGKFNLNSPAQSAPQEQPRQAPDGNYYIPDPQRPGKYLQVIQ